jgi:hypothetical protein
VLGDATELYVLERDRAATDIAALTGDDQDNLTRRLARRVASRGDRVSTTAQQTHRLPGSLRPSRVA